MRLAMTPGRDRQQTPRNPQRSPSRRSARRGLLATLALATALLGAAAPAATNAQAAPRFEVVSVSHQPSGRLTAAVQVSDPAMLTPGTVRVVVDGASRSAHQVTATSIEVMVPPLTVGTHTAQFRVGDKTPIERTVPFAVSNVGLLAVSTVAPSDPAGLIALKVTAPVPLAALPLRLRVGNRDWPLPRTGEALLDPWILAPGATEVEVVAANEAGLIAQTRLAVTIPELKPLLTVKRDVMPSGERLVINGRVQTIGRQSILVRADGQELLRSQEPLAQVTVPGGSEVTVELLAGEQVVRSEVFEVGGALGGFGIPAAAAAVALLLITPFVIRRKRALEPSAAVARALQPAAVRSSSGAVPLAAAGQAAEQMTNIIVRTPEGQTRRILVRRGASLTIGSDALCDIRLADDTVRARHGLLSRMEDGHFELHPITGQPGDAAGASTAGRVLLRPGDPVRIGQHVLVIE